MGRCRFYGRSSPGSERDLRKATDRLRKRGPIYDPADLIETARRTAALTRKMKA